MNPIFDKVACSCQSVTHTPPGRQKHPSPLITSSRTALALNGPSNITSCCSAYWWQMMVIHQSEMSSYYSARLWNNGTKDEFLMTGINISAAFHCVLHVPFFFLVRVLNDCKFSFFNTSSGFANLSLGSPWIYMKSNSHVTVRASSHCMVLSYFPMHRVKVEQN